MAKDFAFMFYPGDYLRDTQCLSEKVQVAYDRIMCEHMRNICISQAQFNFFTKKLNDEERDELKMVLTEVEGGFQIDWVVISISKRIAYSESRSKNKAGKTKKDMKIISKSHDNHMEDENENNTVLKKNTNEYLFPTVEYEIELSENDIGKAAAYFQHAKGVTVPHETIVSIWELFKAKHFTGEKSYRNNRAIISHFLETLKFEKIDGKGSNINNQSVGRTLKFDQP